MIKIKFCGLRRNEDLAYCNELLPDYGGMILSPGFRRSVEPRRAREILRQAAPKMPMIGVFVNASSEEILRTLELVPLQVLQLHGEETAEQIAALKAQTGLAVWKAVRVRSDADIRAAEGLGADCLVLEGFVPGTVGGTGITANWELLTGAKPRHPFFLAGGLKPENVLRAIEIVHPDGVDISSGTETAGVKDFGKMREIVRAVRGWEMGIGK